MIEVEKLSKRYGRVSVLRDANLQVEPGSLAILTGDNGAGKSTLLRILAGLARASGGRASIGGHDVGRARRLAQAQLSFLPQSLTFHPAMTPERLLEFYARLRGKRLDRQQLEGLLDRVDLLAVRQRPVRALSGGMVQRLGIALLLLPEAPVLILDEPAISLDPGWRGRLAELLHEQRAQGRTILMTTHAPAEWEGGCDLRLHCADGGIQPVPSLSSVLS